jgi:hypothetical protein
MKRLAISIALTLVLTLMVSPVSVAAQGTTRVTGGGATVITTLVLSDGSTMTAEPPLPTHLGFAAVQHADGRVSGQFQCLINGPGFTGHFMNLHGDVTQLEVEVTGNTARFSGESNFGPYSVVVTDGPQPTLSLRWTAPFGPGVVGTEEVLTHGSVHIAE